MLRRVLTHTHTRRVGRIQTRGNRIRSKLEKTLEEAALEAVENPLPIDANRIRKQEFRKQREEATSVSGLDTVLGTVGIPVMQVAQAAPWKPQDKPDLPDYMKGSSDAAPLSDIDLSPEPGVETPAFLRQRGGAAGSPDPQKTPEAVVSEPTPAKRGLSQAVHPARRASRPVTGEVGESGLPEAVASEPAPAKRGLSQAVHPARRASRPVTGEVDESGLPDFLKSSPPSGEAVEEAAAKQGRGGGSSTGGKQGGGVEKKGAPRGAGAQAKGARVEKKKASAPANADDDELPDFLKAAAHDGGDDDLPDFLKGDPAPPPPQRQQRPASPGPAEEEDGLPDFLKVPKGGKPSPVAFDDADDDLPDFLKVAPKQGGGAQAKSAVDDADDDGDLPDFLKVPKKGAPAAAQAKAAADDAGDDDLPDFLKVPKGGKPSPAAIDDADDDLPDFLKAPKQGSGAQAKPAVNDADDDDLPDFLKVPKKGAPRAQAKAPIEDADDDLPDFLKAAPKQGGGAQAKPAVDNADDDDLPDFLKVPKKGAPRAAASQAKAPADDADDDLPDFLKVAPKQGGGAQAKPSVNDADDDDLPDFLKVPKGGKPSPAAADDADDDLPDFLKAPKQGGGAQAKPAVNDADDDDLPDFLKVPKKGAPRAQANAPVEDADDDLPDFLKAAPKQGGGAQAKPAVDNADEDDLPDFLKATPKQGGGGSAQAKPAVDNADDDDLPDFLKAAPKQGGGAQAKPAVNNDIPDVLKAAPKQGGSGGAQAKPAVDNADDDDLPDFLKAPKDSPTPPPASKAATQRSPPTAPRPAANADTTTASATPRADATPRHRPTPTSATGTNRSRGKRGTHPARKPVTKPGENPWASGSFSLLGGTEAATGSTGAQEGTTSKAAEAKGVATPRTTPTATAAPPQAGAADVDVSAALGAKDAPDASPRGKAASSDSRKPPAAAAAAKPTQGGALQDDLPDFLKEAAASSGAGSAAAATNPAGGEDDDDLPDFLKGPPQGRKPASTKVSSLLTDDDSLPDFLKAPPAAGAGAAESRQGRADTTTTTTTTASTQGGANLSQGVHPARRATAAAPETRQDPTRASPLFAEESELPSLLQKDSLKGSPAAGGAYRVAEDAALPSFLRDDLGAVEEQVVGGPGAAAAAGDADDLPDFLKEGKGKGGAASARPGSAAPEVPRAARRGGDAPPENLRPPPSGAELPEFLRAEEEPFVSKRATPLADIADPLPPPRRSEQASSAAPVADDDDLPDFLKDLAPAQPKQSDDSDLPAFLRQAMRPAGQRPPRTSGGQQGPPVYKPPLYISDVTTKVSVTLGEGREQKGIKVLDPLTFEPVEASGWWGLRLNASVVSGKAAFGVKVLHGKLTRVGWSTKSANLNLGNAHGSFGYGATGKKSCNKEFSDYGVEYGEGDTVVALIDVESRSISFLVNGTHLGEAYAIPEGLVGSPFIPHMLTKDARLRVIAGEEPNPPDLPHGYQWVTAAAAEDACGPTKTCALCGQGRSEGEMEEMGGGSGFFRCVDGKQNQGCAPERLGRPAVAAQRAEAAEPVKERERAPVEGTDFAARAATSQARSWQALSGPVKAGGTSWRDRASSKGVTKQRCRECWNLVPECELLTDGKGVFYCSPDKPKPCRDITDEQKARDSFSRSATMTNNW